VNSLDLLYRQYMALRKSYARLAGKCKEHEEIIELQNLYRAAWSNYQTALNSVFDENDAEVKRLTSELKAAQEEIERRLRRIGDLPMVLGVIAAGVEVATRLVGLGSPGG
jgi:predicted nuclease with TOPRIM domain